jgi:hypothetical protein
MAFNNGKPYHGSDAVQAGGLVGTTDTDHFYFICPKCRDSQVMRVLDYTIINDGPVAAYPEERPKQMRDFTIAFQLHCPACKHGDFVKISNTGRQGGRVD